MGIITAVVMHKVAILIIRIRDKIINKVKVSTGNNNLWVKYRYNKVINNREVWDRTLRILPPVVIDIEITLTIIRAITEGPGPGLGVDMRKIREVSEYKVLTTIIARIILIHRIMTGVLG
jgi:hypothetical protein